MRGRSASRYWILFVLVLSLVPAAGLFTTSRIFFVRDLSLFFWSRHLWLRHTLFSGHSPWWDPFVAAGQSAIADALNQFLMPVTLAVRLLPSDVVSFNLWIALPLPVAALGTFAFLRGRLPDAAAALGACAFALSGPIVSMLNLPNLSWSVALLPWVMWAVEHVLEDRGARAEDRERATGRPSTLGPRLSILALAFALQALCGEPVTWAATGALAFVYAIFRPNGVFRLTGVFRLQAEGTAWTIAGLIAGALLAAAQLVPTFAAGVEAHRGALATPDFWSLHPLSLWEALAPRLFGNYYDAFLADLPWMGALNFGRDPFLYSIYVGPFVLLLAVAAVAGRPRRTAFWAVIALVFVVAALGGYTPLYPMVRRLIPALMYFRFPAKYIVFTAFAVAVLAAEGFAMLRDLPPDRRVRISWLSAVAGGLGALGLMVSVYAHFTPGITTRAAHALAVATHLKDPAAGAVFLAHVAPLLAVRVCGLVVAGAVLMGVALRRARAAQVCAMALCAATCADLLVTNTGLNPTMAVPDVAPPPWFTASAGTGRLYIGGRVRGFMNSVDPDAAPAWRVPDGGRAVERDMRLNGLLPMAPSGWSVREALSYDLPRLWPDEYEATVRRFEQASGEERDAFLRRSGVRWCALPVSQHRPWRAIADVANWNMRVYDCNSGAARVVIASNIQIALDPSDLQWQRTALFDTTLPDDVVRMARMPARAGAEGAPDPPFARLVEDGTTRVVVEAGLPRAGVIVLRDSFDPSWTAEVDGLPAEIERANGRYRAVSLPPGRHVIRFAYRPRALLTGLIITGMAALGLGFIGFIRFNGFGFGGESGPEPEPELEPRTGTQNRNPLNPLNPLNRSNPSNGFTLIELMIVLAILAIVLAVAFTEYRGMQAKGNEASALSSIRSIAAAQWQFALTCGNMKYAPTLPALGQPVPATGHGFLSPDLTSANSLEKSGYMFQMAAKPLDNAAPACNGVPVADGYAATADPVKPGVSGSAFFGVNADRVLYTDDKLSFTGTLPESGAPPHGAEVK